MRGLRNIINQFRHLRGNKSLIAGVFVLGLGTFVGLGFFSQQNVAHAIARDCDDNAIMRCGAETAGEFRDKCNADATGDLKTIYGHYWIPCDVQVVDGQSFKDNTVRVNGRIVADNAQSIGRQQLNGEHPISISGKTYYEGPNATSFANDGLPTLVALDAQGNFKYAIIKGCGNPIYAHPVAPPPPPQPAMIQVCELATKKIISIKETDFNAQLHSKNLADCQEKQIQVCELATKKIIMIKESQYNAQLHSKNLQDCQVKQLQVCELSSGSIITINENQYDSSKHSKNLEDCQKLTVCDLTTKKIVTIKQSEFDSSKYSKDQNDCNEVPVLPQTGPGGIIGAGLGIGGTIVAASYYAASRRDLLSALLNR